MKAKSQYYFTARRLLRLRQEIAKDGLVADPFLADDANCPVFGLNLTCAFPFPAHVKKNYTKLARRLAALSSSVYVYPFWETHVTVVTFVNFSLHRRAPAQTLADLRAWVAPVIDVIRPLFEQEKIPRFALEFRKPILTRKAVILPINNPSGEISRIRQRVSELLAGNKGLQEKLEQSGLNVPGIIHSTIARWKKTPRHLPRFVAKFDAVAETSAPFSIEVREILFTAETKPYMRRSEILHRFCFE